MASSPEVPLARVLTLGAKGPDVVAAKRALSRAGYMEWGNFTDVYGEFMRNAVHEFQKYHSYKPAGYGYRTHNALVHTKRKGYPKEWAFDGTAITLMHQEYVILHESPNTRIRKIGVQMLRNLYAHRWSIGYSQHRPYRLTKLGDPVASFYDCSGVAGEAHYAGGAVNPNIMGGVRLPWNGEGYTGTLMAGGQRCTRLDMEPLDLVFFGFTRDPEPAFPYGSPTHVAVWDEGGDNLIWTMGSFPFKHTYYNYRTDINCFMHYDVVHGRH